MPNVLTKLIQLGTRSDDPTSGKAPKDKDKDDPIPVGQSNIALGTTVTTVIAAIATLINPELLTRVLGENPSASSRATLAVGLFAAGALIASADLWARGYAAAHRRESDVEPPDKSLESQPSNSSHTFTLTKGKDTEGWYLFAVSGDDAVIYKAGSSPQRVALTEIVAE